MSFLGKLFGGGKSQEKTPSPAEAIQRLRDIEEMLMKKQEYLEKKVEQELALAKKNGRTNKRVALQALKRKKRYEKQLGQIDGTLTTIEFQREALENANTNTEVLKIMGLAAKALKGTHSDMDVDKVHDLMDEVQEQQDIANEISEAISSPVGFGNDVDEDELARELEELEQESLDEQLLDVAGPATENLPSPPTAEPVSNKKDENEKSVTVVLNGRESEMVFVEMADDQEALPGRLASGPVDGYLAVYSVTCRSSFLRARQLLEQWRRWEGSGRPPLILVGNKTDLARRRVVSTENGRSVATRAGCKFIETSAGINHQLDELLVGILSQIRLKSHRTRGRHVRGHTTDLSGQRKARGLIGKILKKARLRSKSCDNLHVL